MVFRMIFMLLEKITMLEFEEGLKQTRSVIVPFGSVEEHGSHLPLGTDTIHAYELACLVSQKKPVFVAPPLWYGLCRSTSQHPGTLTISQPVLRQMTIEIVNSLYHQGIRNFILLSGHAGTTHMAAIIDAADSVVRDIKDINIAVLSIIDLIKKLDSSLVETPGDSHAGEVETSLMMLLRPDDVKGTSPKEFPCFPAFIITRDKRRFWKNGVWGDPSKASKEKGRKILEEEANLLVELLYKLEQEKF